MWCEYPHFTPLHGELDSDIQLKWLLVSSVTENISLCQMKHTMTSSNGNICRVTGYLCGEFTGPHYLNQWWYCLKYRIFVRNSVIAKPRLHITYYSIVKSFRNFAQSLVVSLPCSMQTFKRLDHWNWCYGWMRFCEILVWYQFRTDFLYCTATPDFRNSSYWSSLCFVVWS